MNISYVFFEFNNRYIMHNYTCSFQQFTNKNVYTNVERVFEGESYIVNLQKATYVAYVDSFSSQKARPSHLNVYSINIYIYTSRDYWYLLLLLSRTRITYTWK